AKSSTLQSSTRDKLGTTHLFYFVRFSGFSSAQGRAGRGSMSVLGLESRAVWNPFSARGSTPLGVLLRGKLLFGLGAEGAEMIEGLVPRLVTCRLTISQ
ncbi:MAG: hypothetical protein ACQESR_19355, partial [Planctomycetota bacterium]